MTIAILAAIVLFGCVTAIASWWDMRDRNRHRAGLEERIRSIQWPDRPRR